MDGRGLRGFIGSGVNKHESANRKAGFGGLLTPTKATRRVRAIAAYRTQASLTGGCFRPGIFRICTEFCGKPEASPAAWDNRAAQRPHAEDQGSQGSGKPHRGAWVSGCAGRACSIAVEDGDAETTLRSTWRARNSPGSVDASHCSFATLAHNSQRGSAALLIRTSTEFEQPHRVIPS